MVTLSTPSPLSFSWYVNWPFCGLFSVSSYPLRDHSMHFTKTYILSVLSDCVTGKKSKLCFWFKSCEINVIEFVEMSWPLKWWWLIDFVHFWLVDTVIMPTGDYQWVSEALLRIILMLFYRKILFLCYMSLMFFHPMIYSMHFMFALVLLIAWPAHLTTSEGWPLRSVSFYSDFLENSDRLFRRRR